jgi:hypothetical protein
VSAGVLTSPRFRSPAAHRARSPHVDTAREPARGQSLAVSSHTRFPGSLVCPHCLHAGMVLGLSNGLRRGCILRAPSSCVYLRYNGTNSCTRCCIDLYVHEERPSRRHHHHGVRPGLSRPARAGSSKSNISCKYRRGATLLHPQKSTNADRWTAWPGTLLPCLPFVARSGRRGVQCAEVRAAWCHGSPGSCPSCSTNACLSLSE